MQGKTDAAFVVAAIWLMLFGAWATFKVGRWAYRKATGWKDPTVRVLELWGKMAAVYNLLKGPIINPTMLKEALLKTREAGAVWDTPVYCLVDGILARDPAAWLISDSYAYKPERS